MEFNLMCGEGSTTLIAENSVNYLPAILKLEKQNIAKAPAVMMQCTKPWKL